MTTPLKSIKNKLVDGSLQNLFKTVADNIRTQNVFDSTTLSIEYADIFWFYLYLSRSSTTESFARIMEYLEWRENSLETSAPITLDYILGCNVMNIYSSMPECHFGYDRSHRPVIYYLFGRQNIPQTLQIINRKRIFDYHLWQNDAINEMCYHKSLEAGYVISSSTLVIDADGMTSDTVSPEFLHILNRRAEVNGRYFPYMFDKIIVLNAVSADTKLICILKDFCKSFSPRANVYVTGPEREPLEVLAVHIDTDQLPTEYGGIKGSLLSIVHPFYDAVTFRRAGGGVVVHRQTGISYALSLSNTAKDGGRKASITSNSLGPGVYDTDEEFNTLSVSMGPSLVDALEDSAGRALSTTSSSRLVRVNRSTSVTSSLNAFGGPKSDYVLSGVAMTPSARAALGAFVDLMLGGSPAHTLLSVDMGNSTVGDGQTTISSMSPISNRSLDTLSSSQPLQRAAFRVPTYPHCPSPMTISTPLKPSVFSILIDGVLQTSVGSSMGTSSDVLAVRTSTGVVLLQTSPVGAPVNPSSMPQRSYTPKRITYKKYNGNLVLSAGRVYSLTRGASMSGWLQKWPMRSQSAGGYTHRYFILEDNELKYWKVVPKGIVTHSSASRGSAASTSMPHISDPPKGVMILTPNTVLRKAKTLFGSNIIEIKSEYDTLTICPYSAVEDTAWYSELYHALERVKKLHRDECSNEMPFPEVVWRQQDPSCVAVAADVIDPSRFDESFHRIDQSNAASSSRRDAIAPAPTLGLQYAVLCRVHTGLSSLHSVQIGPIEHASIRLENTDLDLGVKLLVVKLCGDCLVLSGTNGFIGAGRIPHLADVGGQVESRRIYVRRLLNSFHGDDAIVSVLAAPRPMDGREDTYNDISRSLLASADDLGCLCIWHRDRAVPGTAYNPSSSPASTRTGYSWTCVHHAKVGHKISSMSFSPDGNILAVCTVERAILFDISSALSSCATPTVSTSTQQVAPLRHNIRTVVIDDTVGLHTTETVFAVDLSNIGILKVWKVVEGFDVLGSGVSAGDESNGSCSGGRASSVDRSTGNIADKVSFVEMSLEQVLRRFELCISLGDLFSRQLLSMDSTETLTPVVVERSVASDDICSDGDEDDMHSLLHSDVGGEKDKEHQGHALHEGGKEAGESGFCVDPFGYADVFVIDPLRMHLRDWWCDYSSRYLLLGHGRVSALTNFEAPGIGMNGRVYHMPVTNLSSSLARSVEKTEATSTTGLNKRSSNMFWSTLTSSLGRRVICRYYIPLGYHERRKQGADVKLDCIHFVLVLGRCLYETLGDEYYAALLSAWKSSALDFARNTLEKLSHSWFRDITTLFLEVLRRMELSPSLALNSLDELITAVGIEISVGQPPASAVVDINTVLDMFKKLRNGLCLIADDFGIMHIVNSDRKAFITRGIRPHQSNSGKNKSDNLLLSINTDGWEGEDACHMARALVIDPLSHLERTEPFAVAFAIVGLQRVPRFIYNSVMSQDDNLRATMEQTSPSEDRTSAEKLAASIQASTIDVNGDETQEKCIEGLISVMAKDMPPWIRFILTSDTSDCDASG